jgi:hypothetical protein
LVCLLLSASVFDLNESSVFKRVPEWPNRPKVVARVIAPKVGPAGSEKLLRGRRRFANSACTIRTRRFSRLLFALATSQLHPDALICNVSAARVQQISHTHRNRSANLSLQRCSRLKGFSTPLDELSVSSWTFRGVTPVAIRCSRKFLPLRSVSFP